MMNTKSFIADIEILGTPWKVFKLNATDAELAGKDRCGFCAATEKQIVIEDLDTDEDWKDQSEEVKRRRSAEILRHEVYHAFLKESGLWACSSTTYSWALNEEMIDWLAIQSPKIYKVFKDLNILE